ncbi:PadR family transcriptional regulator [Thermatribacter velox]
MKELFRGFMRIHILYHAGNETIYGVWMMSELKKHGYEVSPGTLYPLLHNMEKEGLLKSRKEVHEGRVRKYYRITSQGKEVLKKAREKVKELAQEILREDKSYG